MTITFGLEFKAKERGHWVRYSEAGDGDNTPMEWNDKKTPETLMWKLKNTTYSMFDWRLIEINRKELSRT